MKNEADCFTEIKKGGIAWDTTAACYVKILKRSNPYIFFVEGVSGILRKTKYKAHGSELNFLTPSQLRAEFHEHNKRIKQEEKENRAFYRKLGVKV